MHGGIILKFFTTLGSYTTVAQMLPLLMKSSKREQHFAHFKMPSSKLVLFRAVCLFTYIGKNLHNPYQLKKTPLK